jgi:hypothetical protein
MNNNDRPQKVTPAQSSANTLSDSGDRLDQELAKWFVLHGGRWSGTASELIATFKAGSDASDPLGPQSSRELYSHIESHKDKLRSLGVAVSLPFGYPRMISLSACADESAGKPLSGASSEGGSVFEEIRTDKLASPGGIAETRENAAETLMAMLKTVSHPESASSTTISRLAAAPTQLRSALKKAWAKRPPTT